MRIAVGGFHHETNTFNPRLTKLEHFKVFRGEEIIKTFKDTNSVLGGFIDSSLRYGFELIPTYYAEAPLITGLIEREAFEEHRDRLIEAIRVANPDGILLFLHGAAVADGYDDPEGAILKALREEFREKPIVYACDFHGNATEEWIENCDAVIAYKTSPHVDMYDRGLEAGKLIVEILKGEAKPVMALKKPRILIKGGLMTIVDTPLSLHKSPFFFAKMKALRYERRREVLNVSILAGFGDADVPDAGVSVIATIDKDVKLAEEVVNKLSEDIWRRRHGFSIDLVLTPLEEAVEKAVLSKGRVILADQGDNPAGGGPADSTFILEELKKWNWPDAALIIRDPEVVEEAIKRGAGSEVRTEVGGKTDELHGRPVEVKARIKVISDGLFYNPLRREWVNAGKTAVLRTGETDIVVTSLPIEAQVHPACFEFAGVNVKRKKIIVVKSAHYFRAGFIPEVNPEMILEVDTPGVTTPNPFRVKYFKVKRPIYPLDEL